MLSPQFKGDVESLIRKVGNFCILPYFENLKKDDISFKASPGDPVTIADKKAESLLRDGLLKLLPDSLFIGEETYAEDKSILNFLKQSEKPVWVVDPIDGTDNFIEGKPGFGIMACLVKEGYIVGSWLYEVTSQRMTTYYAPDKMWENGEIIKVKSNSNLPYRGLIGKKLHRFPEVQKLKRESTDIIIDPALEPSIISYREMLLGNIDFLIFKVTYPWDHLPGLAFLLSCGAEACRWNGKPFEFFDTHEGLVVARSQEVIGMVHDSIIQPLMNADEILNMKSFK